MTNTITNTPTPTFVFTHGARYKLADALLDAGDFETLMLLQHTKPGTTLPTDSAIGDALRAYNIEVPA